MGIRDVSSSTVIKWQDDRGAGNWSAEIVFRALMGTRGAIRIATLPIVLGRDCSYSRPSFDGEDRHNYLLYIYILASVPSVGSCEVKIHYVIHKIRVPGQWQKAHLSYAQLNPKIQSEATPTY
jgi:hypothetical protein